MMRTETQGKVDEVQLRLAEDRAMHSLGQLEAAMEGLTVQVADAGATVRNVVATGKRVKSIVQRSRSPLVLGALGLMVGWVGYRWWKRPAVLRNPSVE
jgi:hypothetical protein